MGHMVSFMFNIVSTAKLFSQVIAVYEGSLSSAFLPAVIILFGYSHSHSFWLITSDTEQLFMC